MTDFRVELAGAHQIDGLWPAVAEGLERACQETGGDLTADYLWSECRAARAFLMLVIEDDSIAAASVWRFEKWTSGKKLRCLALYGKVGQMADWLDAHRKATIDMAKLGEATALVTEGRAGFARIFPEARVLRQLYEVAI